MEQLQKETVSGSPQTWERPISCILSHRNLIGVAGNKNEFKITDLILQKDLF